MLIPSQTLSLDMPRSLNFLAIWNWLSTSRKISLSIKHRLHTTITPICAITAVHHPAAMPTVQQWKTSSDRPPGKFSKSGAGSSDPSAPADASCFLLGVARTDPQTLSLAAEADFFLKPLLLFLSQSVVLANERHQSASNTTSLSSEISPTPWLWPMQF